jgi:outer membrane protein
MYAALFPLALGTILLCAPQFAAAQTSSEPLRVEGVSAVQLFEIADKAKADGDFDTAATLYTALGKDPDIEIRTEARFRHAQMLVAQKKFSSAALLYRAILDEKHDTQRVRLELAYVLAQLGDLGGAQRELRLAQAGGLPPEVARLIDQFTNALRANKPIGASIEVALAPDNNINRATKAETLDTIIAPFDLTEDAQAQSSLGLAIKGQTYFRTKIDKRAQLLVRLSGNADLYRQSQFNDVTLGVQAGPEMRSGKDRISFSGGLNYRWFGGTHYATIISTSANMQHPIGTKAQLTLNAAISDFDNKQNNLQDGTIYSASAGLERAFSSRFGAGLTVGAVRQGLSDPGYATASGTITAFAFREWGKTTLVGSIGYSHLEADQRLFLFPRRRIDNRYSASLGATFRQLQLKGFAPVVRVEYERNDSSVGLYEYKRIASSFGITRAF